MAALVFLSTTSPVEPDIQSEENLDFILRIMVAFGDTNLVAKAVATEIVKEMSQCGIASATMGKVWYRVVSSYTTTLTASHR
jgi:hypothetical protein